MKFRHLFFLLLIVLVGCKNENLDQFVGSYHGALPCKVGVHQKDTLYQIDFNERVLVFQNKEIKAIYDNFEIFDLYHFYVQIQKDSLTSKLTGQIYFDIDGYLNLFCDTVSDTIFYIGEYIYHDYAVENIVANGNNLTFDIVFEKDNPYIVGAGIQLDSENKYFKIDTSFIGRLHTETNPSFVRLESDRYLLKTISGRDEFKSTKISFYYNQLEKLEQKLKEANLDSVEKESIGNSIKYLTQLLKVFEN